MFNLSVTVFIKHFKISRHTENITAEQPINLHFMHSELQPTQGLRCTIIWLVTNRHFNEQLEQYEQGFEQGIQSWNV